MPGVRLRRGSQRDLHAAAADVDDDGGGAADVDAVPRGEVDQARFLGAGDDADADPGLPVDLGDEVAAVLGLTGRARCARRRSRPLCAIQRGA